MLPVSFYARFGKRALDILLSVCALAVLWPVLLVLAALVRCRLGSPVLFRQVRPGKDETLFRLCKFRSMTDARDGTGALLPDELRLTPFGRLLRSTSLDELPELWNILRGEMSLVGPRPQLVRDMVFMTPEQRRRHTVRPGLTGLAQVSGRNAIAWEAKLDYDLEYLQSITFLNDCRILLRTVGKVLGRSDTVREGTASDQDFGDWLLERGAVTRQEYDEKQAEALRLLRGEGGKRA